MNDKIQKVIRYPNRIPIENIAALRLIVGKEPNDYIILLGKNRTMDNDAREYSWIADSLSPDDGDLVIIPTDTATHNMPGRWHKVGRLTSADGAFKGQKTLIAGTGTATTFYIEHPFSTTDVVVEVYKITTLETIEVGVVRTLGGVSIRFKVEPEQGEEFKVLILTF